MSARAADSPTAPNRPPASPSDFPVYVMKMPNPNDYELFANGGWDGNWYVGFNTCWIKKLPPIPAGDYQNAFLGVRVGRMKVKSSGKTFWRKRPIPAKIYMAISSTGAWTREQSYLVTDSSEIPLECDPENALQGTGESQWFWAEVPIDRVHVPGDNYVALWSSTPELVSASSAPILAAAWGGKDQDTWLSRDIRGAPPREIQATLGTPISYFQPAMALKLIPRGANHPVNVNIVGWKPGTVDHPAPVVTADVSGDSIEKVWLEYYVDKAPASTLDGVLMMNRTWAPVGRPLWKAPYILNIDQEALPKGRVQLRVAATNIWETRGVSHPFTVDVSTISPPAGQREGAASTTP